VVGKGLTATGDNAPGGGRGNSDQLDMGKSKTFDGIICIGGEDWWYHNRGHFDFQIMRRLAKSWPVLFVNSLGVRMPSLADRSVFAERMARKLKSLARGVVEVEPGFWVFSPVTVPGERGQALSQWALAPQIKLAAARAGIRRPLLWLHCPAGASLASSIDAAAVVMQRTDRFEAFPEGDPHLLSRQVAALKDAADLVIYAAPHLMEEERGAVRRQILVTHGVDVETFTSAGDAGRQSPADIASLPRPRVGFIGGIDAHTFDPELFLSVAARLPDASFAMIGACSLPDDWCRLANVHFLGRKPYDEIAGYMSAMDVLIMPWNKSDWIRACNPIKLKEYLAVGRPIVTRDFPALTPWRDCVRVADTAEDFAVAIAASLSEPYDRAAIRARIAGESWDAKAGQIAEAILALGLAHAPHSRSFGPKRRHGTATAHGLAKTG
jgi:glycosyltransferase involved in cell wall biosynthesis